MLLMKLTLGISANMSNGIWINATTSFEMMHVTLFVGTRVNAFSLITHSEMSVDYYTNFCDTALCFHWTGW